MYLLISFILSEFEKICVLILFLELLLPDLIFLLNRKETKKEKIVTAYKIKLKHNKLSKRFYIQYKNMEATGAIISITLNR